MIALTHAHIYIYYCDNVSRSTASFLYKAVGGNWTPAGLQTDVSGLCQAFGFINISSKEEMARDVNIFMWHVS